MSKTAIDGWKEYFAKEEVKEKANLAAESQQATNIISKLNYASTQEDFDNAQRELDDWYKKTSDYHKDDDKQLVLNTTIYETNNQLINDTYADFENYNNLTNNIETKKTELFDLQKGNEDGKYDFQNIENVLNDYKQIGENILEYNKTWVNKTNYNNNINEINNWISTGKQLYDMDTDEETSGIQLGDNMNPNMEGFMDAAFDFWQIGRVDDANAAIRQSITYIDNQKRLEREHKAAMVEDEMKFLTETYIPILTEDKMTNIENYSEEIINAVSNNTDLPPIPEGLTEDDKKIALEIAGNNNDYTKHFNTRKEVIVESRYDNLEGGAFGVINAFRNKMGKGEGFDAVEADPKLLNLLTDMGSYSTSKGTLRSDENRRAIAQDIAGNIDSIFDYLEGYTRDWFWGKDYYEKNSEVQDLIDGKYSAGTAEWYQNMDAILDSYLPKDERGRRQESSEARNATQSEFGGSNSAMEINGYEILLSALKAYDAIRKLDIEFGNDPANPDNLDL
tara:strand:- start:5472 stop:6992 length:1521 start_codon:yes stop_codon:yes gene_type:complete